MKFDFDRRLRSVSGTFYRGTKEREDRTKLAAKSWTPSIDVAAVYSSAISGDGYVNNFKFVPGSTIHAAEISAARTLDYITYGHQCDFPSLISALGYKLQGGMTEEEARKVLRFLHKRMLGLLKGYPEFAAEAWGSSEERDDEEPLHVGIDFRSQPTCISEYEGLWGGDRQYDGGPIMALDVFAFVDCPTVIEVCERLGIQAVLYADAFDAGRSASKKLFGLSGDDPEELLGVEEKYNEIDFERTWVNETIRPLSGASVRPLWTRPTSEVEHAGNRTRSNPRRRR